ncbi:MAG: hypothetical protein ACI8VT_001872, partial [Saprospiraceae bacterium]
STINAFRNTDKSEVDRLQDDLSVSVKTIRNVRKNQIKRIKNHEIGTRNSVLFLNHLGEYRNLTIFSTRMIKVLDDLILNPDEEN